MTEQEEKGLFERFKNWLAPKNEVEQPDPAATEPQPEPVQVPPAPAEPTEEQQELERLRQENADLKAAQQQHQQAQTEIQALRQENESLKNFVPGGGAPTNTTEPTVNVDHDKNKQVNSPFAIMEQNAKGLGNNRGRRTSN